MAFPSWPPQSDQLQAGGSRLPPVVDRKAICRALRRIEGDPTCWENKTSNDERLLLNPPNDLIAAEDIAQRMLNAAHGGRSFSSFQCPHDENGYATFAHVLGGTGNGKSAAMNAAIHAVLGKSARVPRMPPSGMGSRQWASSLSHEIFDALAVSEGAEKIHPSAPDIIVQLGDIQEGMALVGKRMDRYGIDKTLKDLLECKRAFAEFTGKCCPPLKSLMLIVTSNPPCSADVTRLVIDRVCNHEDGKSWADPGMAPIRCDVRDGMSELRNAHAFSGSATTKAFGERFGQGQLAPAATICESERLGLTCHSGVVGGMLLSGRLMVLKEKQQEEERFLREAILSLGQVKRPCFLPVTINYYWEAVLNGLWSQIERRMKKIGARLFDAHWVGGELRSNLRSAQDEGDEPLPIDAIGNWRKLGNDVRDAGRSAAREIMKAIMRASRKGLEGICKSALLAALEAVSTGELSYERFPGHARSARGPSMVRFPVIEDLPWNERESGVIIEKIANDMNKELSMRETSNGIAVGAAQVSAPDLRARCAVKLAEAWAPDIGKDIVSKKTRARQVISNDDFRIEKKAVCLGSRDDLLDYDVDDSRNDNASILSSIVGGLEKALPNQELDANESKDARFRLMFDRSAAKAGQLHLAPPASAELSRINISQSIKAGVQCCVWWLAAEEQGMKLRILHNLFERQDREGASSSDEAGWGGKHHLKLQVKYCDQTRGSTKMHNVGGGLVVCSDHSRLQPARSLALHARGMKESVDSTRKEVMQYLFGDESINRGVCRPMTEQSARKFFYFKVSRAKLGDNGIDTTMLRPKSSSLGLNAFFDQVRKESWAVFSENNEAARHIMRASGLLDKKRPMMLEDGGEADDDPVSDAAQTSGEVVHAGIPSAFGTQTSAPIAMETEEEAGNDSLETLEEDCQETVSPLTNRAPLRSGPSSGRARVELPQENQVDEQEVLTNDNAAQSENSAVGASSASERIGEPLAGEDEARKRGRGMSDLLQNDANESADGGRPPQLDPSALKQLLNATTNENARAVLRGRVGLT